jgi:hypothetical protein
MHARQPEHPDAAGFGRGKNIFEKKIKIFIAVSAE